MAYPKFFDMFGNNKLIGLEFFFIKREMAARMYVIFGTYISILSNEKSVIYFDVTI